MGTKVLFLGTPEFACPTLEMLLSNSSFEVVGVVTQPDKPAGRNLEVQSSRVKIISEKYLASITRAAKKFPIYTPADINDPDFLRDLSERSIDVAVVVAYGKILSQKFLNIFQYGAVNVHASLLPRWRGAAPIPWAILSNDTTTGVTLQKVALKLDTGDILATATYDIEKDCDAPKLYTELSRRGAELVRRTLPDYIAGKIQGQKQDETKATYASKITKEMGAIDWNKTASDITRQIRALTPWPGTWTKRSGKVIKILRADAMANISGLAPGKPGDLIGLDRVSFVVMCGDKTGLRVSVLQPESRSRMAASEYMKGHPFGKGDFLGS